MKVFHGFAWMIAAALTVAQTGLARADIALPEGQTAIGKTRFISNNNRAWWARYKLLKAAQKSIIAQYFTVEDDVFGESFLALLLQKAREGKEVKLMVDVRGTAKLSRTLLGQDYLQKLVDAGAEVRTFNPWFAHGIGSDPLSSNHKKILLVDDRYFITGGRNISQKYFLNEDDLPTSYHDADVVVDSAGLAPAVREAFMSEFNSTEGFRIKKDLFGDWSHREKTLLRGLDAMEDRMRNFELSETSARRHPELGLWTGLLGVDDWNLWTSNNYVAASGMEWNEDPTNEVLQEEHPVTLLHNISKVAGKTQQITDTLHALIRDAKEEVLIENAYVVLTEETRQALHDAAVRGVKVIISTNGPTSTDSILTEAVIVNEWKQVLKDIPDALLFLDRGPQKLHAKVFVIDRKRALIGSFNMDYMSDRINSEVAVLVDSPSFAEVVRDDILEHYTDHSDQITPEHDPAKIHGAAHAVARLKGIYQVLSKRLKRLL